LEVLFKEVCVDLLKINDKVESVNFELQKEKLAQVGVSVEGQRNIGSKKSQA
jgi:uncharacterized protein YaiE (UPF0345 family)